MHKAFDGAPHLPLLEKNGILWWISEYLANRLHSGVVNGESSLPALVISGVPQATFLVL